MMKISPGEGEVLFRTLAVNMGLAKVFSIMNLELRQVTFVN
jgi:hypothetical protein